MQVLVECTVCGGKGYSPRVTEEWSAEGELTGVSFEMSPCPQCEAGGTGIEAWITMDMSAQPTPQEVPKERKR